MKTKFLIPLLAVLGLLCACGGRNSAYNADTTGAVITHAKLSVNTSDITEISPKVVKTADMRFEVKSVRQAAEQITALTASYSGAVVHHVMRSVLVDSLDIRKSEDSVLRVTNVNSTAEMTVKVPPANMESFMQQVARLGIQVNDQKMDAADKSLDYLSTRLKLKNQHELVEQQKTATINKKDPDNLLNFKNNMVDQQIKNLRTEDSVKSSVVILSFYENSVNKRMIANNDLSAYKGPLSNRLALSFENGWNVFVEIMVGLANFWMLIPIGLGVWMGVRYYRRRALVKS